MKKLLVVFFALSLVLAFTMPAMATDVEISGSYYVRGWYDANSALTEDSTSNALYQQRLRISAIFKVARGLKLSTRMDALETTWGTGITDKGNDGYGPYYKNKGYDNMSSAWSVEQTRLDFATKYGLVSVGIWDTNEWGCTFGNNSYTTGSLMFVKPIGKFIVLAKLEKAYEGDAKSYTAGATAASPATLSNGYSDYDTDAYVLATVYRSAGVEAGLLYKYVRIADRRDWALLGTQYGYYGEVHVVSPYVKYKAGDLSVEAQIYWLDGNYKADETGGKAASIFGADKPLEGLTWYVMAKYKIDPVYTIGAFAAFSQGDDPSTRTVENALVSGGWDWNPCLILWNDDFNYKANGYLGHINYAATDGEMKNAYIYQVFFEATPIDKLTINSSFSYAYADEKPTNFVDDVYGIEFDISASYKIYDNLDYMVGFGYFWAGDFYKGTTTANEIDDTYLLVNKLTLSF